MEKLEQGAKFCTESDIIFIIFHNNCMLGYVTRLSMVQCMSVANMVLFVLGCFVFTLNRMNYF